MFCARCGSFIGNEYARFCPSCGSEVKGHSTQEHGQHYAYESNSFPDAGRSTPKKKSKKWTITASIAVALVFGILLSMADIDLENDSNKRIEIQTLTEDTYFELSGDFLPERGIFSVGLTDDGSIAFTLSDEVASKYDHYSWLFFDNDHVSSTSTTRYQKYTGTTLEKDEPVLYYLSQNAGEYDVSVKCGTGSDGNYNYTATYSGTVSYVGTVTKEYTWKYQGEGYVASTTFSYEDYRTYRDMNPNGRHVLNYGRTASFVTYEDPAVIKLAESIREAYGSDRDTTGQDFAMFVLAFVQICFEYPPSSSTMDAEMYQYGQDEYFAYPLETIFYGMGDCEDTSILAAALFKALGYAAGVVIVPGHALAAVGLDHYSPGTYSSRSYEVISETIDGITYYACETTVKTPQGIGLVSLSGYEGKAYSEHIGKQRYGFYIV
ncbi:MAG: hypothetical protein FWG41_03075 [Methanomassiliicoccaceae archaeon]|nr:hypothetical protein [Methanomassiliicoccaceae archaeon]